MGFADSTLFMKIAMGLGLAGSLFDYIGLAAPYWLTSEVSGINVTNSTNTLLFQTCQNVGNVSSCESLTGVAGSVAAAQALNVMGFLTGVGSTVLIVYYIQEKKKIVRLLALAGAFVAAGFILIGVIIVGTELNPDNLDVGWAMIMAIIGAVIFIGSGVLVVVDVVVKSPPPASKIMPQQGSITSVRDC